MLSPFTFCFHQRFSGTGKNGPSASLLSLSRLSPRIPRRWIPCYPANRRLFPPCGPNGGDGHLIRQRRHTACYWQLSMFHSDYGWCGPPTCLLSAGAPVETGTPPRSFQLTMRGGGCQGGTAGCPRAHPRTPSQTKSYKPRNMTVDTALRRCTIIGRTGKASRTNATRKTHQSC